MSTRQGGKAGRKNANQGLKDAASKRACALFLGVLLMSLVACGPEATRRRGSGDPGADIGNRGPQLVIHAGADPYYGAPRLQPPVTTAKK